MSEPLYAHVRALLATLSDPRANALAEELPKAHELTAAALPPAPPPDALDRLGPAAPETELLVAHIRAEAPRLAWRQPYGPSALPQAVLDATRWAPLADKAGPLRLEDALVELMTIDARAAYPRHSHAPEELYVVLAGGVHWTAEDDPASPAWRDAGATIHHPPHRPHALETGADAALILTIWRGGGFEIPDLAPAAARPLPAPKP